MFVDEDRSTAPHRPPIPITSSVDLGYGRFLQADPIGYDAGLNWYNYVGDDPINSVDPSGLLTAAECEAAKAAGEIVVCGRSGPDPSPYQPIDVAPKTGIFGGATIEFIFVDGASSQNQPPCGPSSLLPHGGGLSVGGSASAGIPGVLGGAVNAAAGGGAFYSSNTGASVGAFASGGAAAYAGGNSASAVGGSRPAVLGASASGGLSMFITNAQSAQQLSGPFTNYSVDVGFGPIQGTISLSVGGGIYQLGISPPFAGMTYGASASKLTTTTVATSGCH